MNSTVKGDPGSMEGLINVTAILFFSSQSPHEYHIIDVINKFAMDAKCSFSELRKSSCGDFHGSPFAMRGLLEGKDDIVGH